MTYCCGLLVRDGLVMIADTRTNAGIDDVSTFRKLYIVQVPGQRLFALSCAGNLSLTQSVISTLSEGIPNAETGEIETLINAPTLFQAAQRVGRAMRQVHAAESAVLAAAQVRFDISFLFGGQIAGERQRLFTVYGTGNLIECTAERPFLQIGEHKYGKPILDRAAFYDMDLYDALKIGLISMDSTMRSNIGVSLPLDLLIMRQGSCAPELSYRIEADDAYFQRLRERWSHALRAAHAAIPRPPYPISPLENPAKRILRT